MCCRQLRASGQKLGASAVMVHIQKRNDNFSLQMGNVGDVECVVSRRGEAMRLSRLFSVTDDKEECMRICQADGIITEVSHRIDR